MSDNSATPAGSPPAPSSQPGDISVEQTIQQVQNIDLGQEGFIRNVHQEDSEIFDVASVRDSTSPNANAASSVTSEGLSRSVQAPIAASSPAGSSTTVTNPLESVKKLVWRRDSFVRLLLDMVDGNDLSNEQGQKHIESMRIKVENMNRLISTVKQSAKLSESHVTASMSGDNEGISLSKQDLPKFQLRSNATKYFPAEMAYDSVHHFLRSFEKVILSSGKAVENVWRRYIPLTIPYDLDLWLNQDLLTAKSWSVAKEKFTSKFSNAALRLDARREVQTATMKPGETTEEYYNRFARAMMEAGYSSEDTTLGDTFLLGFPSDWQIQINAVLGVHYPNCSNFTTSQIVNCAMNVLNSQKCPMSFGKAEKHDHARHSAPTSDSSSSAASSAPRFYCSNHGGSQARHHEKDCRRNKGNSSSKHAVGSSSDSKATESTFCMWCGKHWFHGHSCSEYQTKKGSFKVLNVKRGMETHRPYSGKDNQSRRSKHKGKGKQRDSGSDERDSGSDESDLFREAMEDNE